MSDALRQAAHPVGAISRSRIRWLVPVIVVLAIFLLFNLGGSLMNDDEGAAFYEAWRLQQGEEPGVDFIAENQPLFLIAGRTIMDIAGRSPLALRLLSATPLLLGAFALGLVISRIWGAPAGALAMALIAGNGIVYEQARIFRPDAAMLGWEMIGLAAALTAVRVGERKWWAVAGICYGLAVLWKLFGVFPVLGLALVLADRLRRKRGQWRQVVGDGLSFAIPFLLVSMGTSIFLYASLGFYYGEAFGYHAAMEAGVGFLVRAGRNVLVFLLFFWTSPVFLVIWPLWYVNRRLPNAERSVIRLLAWQLASLTVFLFITRPVHVRYFLYVVPVMAILLAWQFKTSLSQIARSNPGVERYLSLAVAVVALLATATSRPSPYKLIRQDDTDTQRLAEYVASHTEPDDVVLSDYATINFIAHRPSIYEASIIAGGQIESGAVTRDLLIRRLESKNAQMVLVHVEGGNPFPHQLVRLDDYEGFRTYLKENFELLTVFDRNEQQIEVYKRR